MSLIGLHYHHRGMLTLGLGYKERADEIRRVKPKSEVEERLRHMWKVSEEALADMPQKTRNMLIEADRLFAGADRVWTEAGFLCAEANRLWTLEAHEAWHARWCPAAHSPQGCRWDGQRLTGIGHD